MRRGGRPCLQPVLRAPHSIAVSHTISRDITLLHQEPEVWAYFLLQSTLRYRVSRYQVESTATTGTLRLRRHDASHRDNDCFPPDPCPLPYSTELFTSLCAAVTDRAQRRS